MLPLPAQGPEFNTQSLHDINKTLSVVANACDFSTGEVEMGGSLEYDVQADWRSHRTPGQRA